MAISVTYPINPAIERTKRILFKPFAAGKWFGLGFCAFLASLGEGGGGAGGNFGCPGPGGGGGGGRGPIPGPGPMPGSAPALTAEFQRALDWVEANVLLLLALVCVGTALVLGLIALFDWLSSRGRFMFIDGIVHNRGLVQQPWREQREPANSFYGAIFLIDTISVLATLLVFVVCAIFAWPDLRAETFGASSLTAVIVGGLIFLPLTLLLVIAKLLLNDFVAPAMYIRQVPVGPAWDAVRRELITGHVGTIVLFYLMKIVINIVVGIIGMLVICATCCIAAIPYLSAVVLLPLLVFLRSYGLYFIEQYGSNWRIFAHDSGPPRCVRCGYDLTLNVSGVCPECGTPTGLTAPPTVPPPVPPSM